MPINNLLGQKPLIHRAATNVACRDKQKSVLIFHKQNLLCLTFDLRLNVFGMPITWKFAQSYRYQIVAKYSLKFKWECRNSLVHPISKPELQKFTINS